MLHPRFFAGEEAMTAVFVWSYYAVRDIASLNQFFFGNLATFQLMNQSNDPNSLVPSFPLWDWCLGTPAWVINMIVVFYRE